MGLFFEKVWYIEKTLSGKCNLKTNSFCHLKKFFKKCKLMGIYLFCKFPQERVFLKMISSMTGYGRAEMTQNGKNIIIEIRSVNSRYFEYTCRISRSYIFLEDKLKRQLNEKIARGKVDISVAIQEQESESVTVQVNTSLAKSYLQAMLSLSQDLKMTSTISLKDIAAFPDVLSVKQAEINQDAVWLEIQQVCQQALDRFCMMRQSEGKILQQDILDRLQKLQEMAEQVDKKTQNKPQIYMQKLYQRLQELLQDTTIEQSRLLTEAAIFADKTAVDEELVRLQSHIQQYREILQLSEPVGRKLDFLTQELNREVNTIGSKAQDLEITRYVVDMKAEIEKIREQVQNIE